MDDKARIEAFIVAIRQKLRREGRDLRELRTAEEVRRFFRAPAAPEGQEPKP